MWTAIKQWILAKLEAWWFPERAAERQKWLAAYEREQSVIADINAGIEKRANEIKAVEARVDERSHRILEIENEKPKETIDALSDNDVLRAPLRRSDR